MTDDEKEFVKFSQILQEWIPAGSVQTREAALIAASVLVDTGVRPLNGTKTLASANNGATTQNGSEPKHLPAPHVKQDGSG
jgi:hypothetical protein